MQYVIGVRGSAGELGDRARVLEALGYHGLSFGDHRATVRSPYIWTALSSIAANTTAVTIVSTFSNNLFRDPTEFVQASLALQSMSGGRFEAGIGAGWARGELEAIGRDLPGPTERLDRLAEACTIARPLLRGEALSYSGAYYAAEFGPSPGVDPPPLVAALGGPVSCRRIAPLVDRVEVMFGAAVAHGSLDFSAWAGLSLDELRRRIEIARAASPTVKIGVGVFVAAGVDDDVRRLSELAGDGIQSRLIGEPGAVADGLRELDGLEIDRVGMTPMTDATAVALGPELL